MQTTIGPRAPPCRPTISLRGVRVRTYSGLRFAKTASEQTRRFRLRCHHQPR